MPPLIQIQTYHHFNKMKRIKKQSSHELKAASCFEYNLVFLFMIREANGIIIAHNPCKVRNIDAIK
jgi:hypothetical protein